MKRKYYVESVNAPNEITLGKVFVECGKELSTEVRIVRRFQHGQRPDMVYGIVCENATEKRPGVEGEYLPGLVEEIAMIAWHREVNGWKEAG